MEIEVKRVYEEPSKDDGFRLLVDRLWPRGIKKENLRFDSWIKEIAPSNELRSWYHKDLSQFKEFEKKYIQELNENKSLWKPLLDKYAHEKVTLLFSSKNLEHNHAQFLKIYLKKIYSRNEG